MSKIENLLQPPEYRQQRQHIFPSDASLQWFCRSNRDELVKRGALVKPTGRPLIAVEQFDQAVVEIGAQKAAKG